MGIETEVNGVEELHTLRVGMVQYLTDCIQPDLELVILLDITILVSPVCRQSLLCDLVHAPATYLYLYPLSIGS